MQSGAEVRMVETLVFISTVLLLQGLDMHWTDLFGSLFSIGYSRGGRNKI
jgi:hypothetical protein